MGDSQAPRCRPGAKMHVSGGPFPAILTYPLFVELGIRYRAIAVLGDSAQNAMYMISQSFARSKMRVMRTMCIIRVELRFPRFQGVGQGRGPPRNTKIAKKHFQDPSPIFTHVVPP